MSALIVSCGLSFAGKSTLARALTARFGYEEVDVDASRNPTREERARAREVAQRGHVRLLTIFVDTPEQVARQRRQNNQVTKARRDLSDDQFEEFNRVFQPPAEEERALVFRSGDETDSWLSKNAADIQGLSPSAG